MNRISEIIPIAHKTLGPRVYCQLKSMLIAGQSAPEKIMLLTLAAAIGTSHMPVRNPLRQLMELLPNRVFHVPPLSRSRIIELKDIRPQLTGFSVKRAARRIEPAQFQKAVYLSEYFNFECKAAQPDPSNLITNFTIYKAAWIPALQQIIEGLWTQISPLLNLDVRKGSERISRQTSCEHHSKLLNALQQDNPAQARDALPADITSACEYVLAQNQLPD